MTSKKNNKLKELSKKLYEEIKKVDFKTENPASTSIIIILLIISVGIVAITRNVMQVKNNRMQYAKWQERQEVNEKKDANINVYEKIRKGENINVLILGDDIGLGVGSSNTSGSWVNQFSSWIGVKYGVNVNTTNLSLSDGTAYSGFNQLMENASNEQSTYDLVFIVYGDNDQKNTNPEEFGILYEGIIRQLRECNIDTTIIPIVENVMNGNNPYSRDIINLSNHYNLNYINATEIFNRKENSKEKLSDDSKHPNDKGYELYFYEIKKLIEKNVGDITNFTDTAKNTQTNPNIKPFYSDFIDLKSYKEITAYKDTKGFDRLINIMQSNSDNAWIEYEVTGNNIGLKYKSDPNGAKMEIYVNNKLCSVVDTKDDEAQDHYILLSTGETQDKSVIKIVQLPGEKANNDVTKNNNKDTTNNNKANNKENENKKVTNNNTKNEEIKIMASIGYNVINK